jgi:flagellar motor switch protein FliG
MMNGKEKALVLVSVLGDKAQVVLPLLSQPVSHLLTSSLGDSPKPDSEDLQAFLMETIGALDVKRQEALFEAPMDEDLEDEALVEEPITETFDSLEKDEFFEAADPEEKPERDPTLRSASYIARLISEQKPQIRAFFLSRLDDAFRSDILTYLPDDVIADYESRSVENIPLSDKVFDGLYESFCRKQSSDSELEDDDDTEDDFSSFF